MLKKIGNITVNILLGLLILLVFSSIFINIQSKRNFEKVPAVFGFSPMTVLTGSMRPELEPGDLIIVKKINPQKIEKGDVITYKLRGNTLVTHRVTEIINENGQMMFRTKGDANNTEDAELVSLDNLVGSLALSIPKAGNLKEIIMSKYGFLVFILIPIIILIIIESKKIIKELSKGSVSQ